MKTNRRVAVLPLAFALSLAFGCDKKKEETVEAEAGKTGVVSASAASVAKAALGKAVFSKAYEHLPAGCLAALVIDVQAISKDKLVAEHLVKPLQANLGRVLKSPTPEEKEAQQALELLGIQSAEQLDSVALCAGGFDFAKGSPEGFVMIVGGEFTAAGDFISVMAKLVTTDKEAEYSQVKVGGVAALKNTKENTLVAQAPNGALIVASDEKMLESALKPSESYKKYELSLSHHLAIALTDKLTQQAVADGGKGSPLQGLKPGSMTLAGSANGKMNGKVTMASPADAAQSASVLNVILGQMAASPDPTAKALVGAVKLTAEGTNLTFAVNLPPEMVESGIKDMGVQLLAQLAAEAGASDIAPTK